MLSSADKILKIATAVATVIFGIGVFSAPDGRLIDWGRFFSWVIGSLIAWLLVVRPLTKTDRKVSHVVLAFISLAMLAMFGSVAVITSYQAAYATLTQLAWVFIALFFGIVLAANGHRTSTRKPSLPARPSYRSAGRSAGNASMSSRPTTSSYVPQASSTGASTSASVSASLDALPTIGSATERGTISGYEPQMIDRTQWTRNRHMYGSPGAGLENSGFDRGAIEAGQAGEKNFGKILYLSAGASPSSSLLSQVHSFWSMRMPSDENLGTPHPKFSTDIDCVIVAGETVFLIDLKQYPGGNVRYHVQDPKLYVIDQATGKRIGRTREMSKNMMMATDLMQAHMSRMEVKSRVLIMPSAKGQGDFQGIMWPGGIPAVTVDTMIDEIRKAALASPSSHKIELYKDQLVRLVNTSTEHDELIDLVSDTDWHTQVRMYGARKRKYLERQERIEAESRNLAQAQHAAQHAEQAAHQTATPDADATDRQTIDALIRELNTTRARLHALELKALRAEIAAELGVPVLLLSGDTEAEIRASATTALTSLSSAETGAASETAGARSATTIVRRSNWDTDKSGIAAIFAAAAAQLAPGARPGERVPTGSELQELGIVELYLHKSGMGMQLRTIENGRARLYYLSANKFGTNPGKLPTDFWWGSFRGYDDAVRVRDLAASMPHSTFEAWLDADDSFPDALLRVLRADRQQHPSTEDAPLDAGPTRSRRASLPSQAAGAQAPSNQTKPHSAADTARTAELKEATELATHTSDITELNRLSQHDAWQVRKAVAFNAATPETVVESLMHDQNWGVRAAIASRTTSHQTLHLLASDSAWSVRAAVASNPNIYEALSEFLTKDVDERVREAAGLAS